MKRVIIVVTIRWGKEKYLKSQRGFKERLSQSKGLTREMNIVIEGWMDGKMNIKKWEDYRSN